MNEDPIDLFHVLVVVLVVSGLFIGGLDYTRTARADAACQAIGWDSGTYYVLEGMAVCLNEEPLKVLLEKE